MLCMGKIIPLSGAEYSHKHPQDSTDSKIAKFLRGESFLRLIFASFWDPVVCMDSIFRWQLEVVDEKRPLHYRVLKIPEFHFLDLKFQTILKSEMKKKICILHSPSILDFLQKIGPF